MIVAIHQPNYAPWLGYFAKMARADVFVLLDDAQYTKNSYINRVQIDAGGTARWLTVPVTYSFGDPIHRVHAADENWRRAHCDALKTHYAGAAAFKSVWPWVAEHYAALPTSDLAASNMALIGALAERLGIRTALRKASALAAAETKGDDRLIALVNSFGADATYLSGRGGDKYQDPSKFAAAGVGLAYSDFEHPIYDQGHPDFVTGLSVLDAVFRLGWERTAELLARAAVAA